MIVDGRAIAEEIRQELKKRIEESGVSLTLGIVSTSDSPVTEKYMNRKRQFAESIGVSVVDVRVSPDADQTAVETAVQGVVDDLHISGILIQLPLSTHINARAVFNVVPLERDPDVLSDKARALFEQANGMPPPVIGAMKDILDRNAVTLSGKNVVVVGEGNLVGKPAMTWVKHERANVTLVTEYTRHPESFFKDASVLILGAGRPGLVQPDMIKENVVILDAGTTDVRGSLQGDADPSCAAKSSLFTPVPGGIGPVTIAMLFKNLVALSRI